jgi:hypothetical protein
MLFNESNEVTYACDILPIQLIFNFCAHYTLEVAEKPPT